MSQDNTPINKTTAETEQSAAHEDKHESAELEQQWQALTQDWQAQPFEKTDINALLKQTKKRTLWAKACFGLNILATVSLLIAFLYGVVNGELGEHLNTYFGLGGLMSLVFVYYENKIRAQAWSQINHSPDQAIDNALAGYQSSLKYMVLTKWSCLPFGVLANWFIYSVGQQSEKSTLGGLIFINAFLLVIYVVTEMLHRKRKKEYRELLTKTANL